MAIRIKIAETSRELNDVYRLRHAIYNVEEGLFQEATHGVVIDVFDAIPEVANIIAYDGTTPVGTLRVNRDSALGLPAEGSFDFSQFRQRAALEAKQAREPAPRFGSAGMLAITKEWRNRRDVFRALFRMAADLGHAWRMSHVIATVNADTAGIYKRLGWHQLADKVWIEEIGNSIVPFASPVAPMYEWAFGMFRDKSDLMDHFSGCFQWLLVDGGAEIFHQDDPGDEAFLVTRGTVTITRGPLGSGKSFTLGKLGPGTMLGEMALIEDAPRSATATATSNTELVVINREAFWRQVDAHPEYSRDLMRILSRRLRESGDRALVQASGSLDERLDYFVGALRRTALPSLKDPAILVAKVSVEEFADMANASLDSAQAYLDDLQSRKILTVNKRDITFLQTVES